MMKPSLVGRVPRQMLGLLAGFAFSWLVALAWATCLPGALQPEPCCQDCRAFAPKDAAIAECQHSKIVKGKDDVVCNDESGPLHQAGFCIVTILMGEFCMFGGDYSDGVQCKTEEVEPQTPMYQYLYKSQGICPAKVEGKVELCLTQHISQGEDCSAKWLFCASCRTRADLCMALEDLRGKSPRGLYAHKCKM